MSEPAQLEIEYTEAELTGEDIPEPGSPDKSAETPPGEPATPKESEPAKEEPTPEIPPEKPPEIPPEKPPKGYVPEGAMKEERRLRRELQAKLDSLEAAKKAEPAKDPKELILEDPQEAVGLLLQRIEDLQTELARTALEREITSTVPDFFDKAPQMEELLLGEGFSEETIRNMIGATGREAPKLFKVLSKLVDVSDTNAMRAKIIEEITPQITKTLMEKFKITEPGKNISRLPGSSPDGQIAVDGEKGYEKLTPEQQEKWLNGEI